MFSFSINFDNKIRTYYCEKENEYKCWIRCINKVTGYVNLLEKYEIKQKLDQGKFGEVRLCVQKENKRKAAIKIINKKEVNVESLHLLRSEIEILKICLTLT